MKVIPQSGPIISQPPSAQAAGRDRAIAMIQGQQAPVANPSQVSPEELSAIKAPSSQNDTGETIAPSSAEPVAPAPPKEDPLQSQYALLARKEKALRAKFQAQDAATKAREGALLAREEALKAKESDYQSNYIAKSKLKSDPLSVLTEEGVSYDEITQAILNPRAAQDPRILAEIDKLKAEIKQSRDSQEQAKSAYEEQQKQSYKQAVNQIHNEVKQLVKSDPNFETIRETRNEKEVVALIEKTYHADGVLLSHEEAAQAVEEFLVERYTKIAGLNKIKSKMQAANPVAEQAAPGTAKQQPQMKTLTNAVNASKKLSVRERAILAFKNELK